MLWKKEEVPVKRSKIFQKENQKDRKIFLEKAGF
jgi:hypothetical protein